MCFINGFSLVVIINIGATHSFILHDCMVKLNLVVSHMKKSMVINTPASGLVTTSLVLPKISFYHLW